MIFLKIDNLFQVPFRGFRGKTDHRLVPIRDDAPAGTHPPTPLLGIDFRYAIDTTSERGVLSIKHTSPLFRINLFV